MGAAAAAAAATGPAGAPLLCLWLLLGAQALLFAEPADVSLPPEDMDSSGDDDDTFSGSGAGSLPDHPVVAWNVPLQEVTNASAIWELSTALGDNQPKVQETTEPKDDYTTVPVFTTIPPVFYTIDPVPGKSGGAVEDDVLDSLSEQGTTRSTVVTTGFPATHHHVSTVRIATTSQASSTLKVAEPEVYHNTHHILTTGRKIPASEAVPTSERHPVVTSSTTVSSVVQTDNSFLPEGEVIQTEEGSADQGDFVFLPHDENQSVAVESEPDKTAMDIGPKDEKSAGAPQGIMDRKEVLGGVIAGGLVGLLFAGFLVGFMLYRMKKKDEGSYSLDEPKQSNGGYQKPHKQEEFYA